MNTIKGPQTADPFILLSFKPLAFCAPTLGTTLVLSFGKQLSWGVNEVHQCPPQTGQVTSTIVRGAPIQKVFVQTCVVQIPIPAGLFGVGPPSTHIHSAPNIEQPRAACRQCPHRDRQFIYICSSVKLEDGQLTREFSSFKTFKQFLAIFRFIKLLHRAA